MTTRRQSSAQRRLRLFQQDELREGGIFIDGEPWSPNPSSLKTMATLKVPSNKWVKDREKPEMPNEVYDLNPNLEGFKEKVQQVLAKPTVRGIVDLYELATNRRVLQGKHYTSEEAVEVLLAQDGPESPSDVAAFWDLAMAMLGYDETRLKDAARAVSNLGHRYFDAYFRIVARHWDDKLRREQGIRFPPPESQQRGVIRRRRSSRPRRHREGRGRGSNSRAAGARRGSRRPAGASRRS